MKGRDKKHSETKRQRQNKTKVGLKAARAGGASTAPGGQNKTKVGLKASWHGSHRPGRCSQNKTKVGLKVEYELLRQGARRVRIRLR